MHTLVVGHRMRNESPFLAAPIHELSYLSHLNNYAMDHHTHPGIELILCISGITLLEINDKQYTLVPGVLVVMPAHMSHRIRVVAPPYRRWLLHTEYHNSELGQTL